MKLNRIICIFALIAACGFGLAGCALDNKQPDFSGCRQIAELATMDCTYHNVAEIRDDGTNYFFGAINVDWKKAWFEYDGTVRLGIDASKVKIEGPDANGRVTIAVPQAQVLGQPDADESTFSDVWCDKGLLASITTVDQSKAYETAQANMRESAESDQTLMITARERAKTLLGQYVTKIGEQLGQSYEIVYVDAE